MTPSTVQRATPAPTRTAPATPGIRACPECGRPAMITDRFTLPSTDGPVEHIRLSCAGGRHHLTLITEGHGP